MFEWTQCSLPALSYNDSTFESWCFHPLVDWIFTTIGFSCLFLNVRLATLCEQSHSNSSILGSHPFPLESLERSLYAVKMRKLQGIPPVVEGVRISVLWVSVKPSVVWQTELLLVSSAPNFSPQFVPCARAMCAASPLPATCPCLSNWWVVSCEPFHQLPSNCGLLGKCDSPPLISPQLCWICQVLLWRPWHGVVAFIRCIIASFFFQFLDVCVAGQEPLYKYTFMLPSFPAVQVLKHWLWR